MKKLLLAFALIFSVGSLCAQTKIGHVNSQKVLDTLPSRTTALQKLKEFEVNGMAELQEMEADLQKAYQKYEAERPNMSPVIIKIEEEKIMKKQQDLQMREQSLNQEMQAYSAELNGPILQLVQDAVSKVAEMNKLNYVIDETVTLYFANGIDITDQVITEVLKMDTAK